MHKFQPNFYVGAATAAHQVEGNNIHSDLWAMEHMKNTSFIEPSLDALDHYNRYEEDIILMEKAGLNAYRFSIEWARIEPVENQFEEKEVVHYQDVIACCKKHGLEPIVTLHHFSSPKWLISKGGWEAETTPDDFLKYVTYVIQRIGSDINYVCTINEANMGIQVAAIAKRYQQQMMAQMEKTQNTEGLSKADSNVQVGINLEKILAGQKIAAEENMQVFGVKKVENFTSMRTPNGDRLIIRAHEKARTVIKELFPKIKVGLTLSLHDIQAQPGGEKRAIKEWEDEFIHYLPYIQQDDFLGIQNYTRSLIGEEGQLPNPKEAELTQMNYEFYPEALEHVIRRVFKEFKGDLFITENGVATSDDSRRIEFIRRALEGIQSCLADGIPIKGYFYWSLLDNFEWQKGYSMTFGLIEVDRTTQTRIPKQSLNYLGSYCSKKSDCL